jgi:hypothetical protein
MTFLIGFPLQDCHILDPLEEVVVASLFLDIC